nr:hypothetical protein [Deltaproteobacteria bacterium]
MTMLAPGHRGAQGQREGRLGDLLDDAARAGQLDRHPGLKLSGADDRVLRAQRREAELHPEAVRGGEDVLLVRGGDPSPATELRRPRPDVRCPPPGRGAPAISEARSASRPPARGRRPDRQRASEVRPERATIAASTTRAERGAERLS